jgi:hypothetical protein
MNLDDELGSALNSAVRHGLRIILLSVAAGAAMLAWSLKQPRNWTSTFAIVPEVEASDGQSLLANELGLSTSASQGPDFYAEYLRSKEAFYEIVRRKFPRNAAGTDSVFLADLLDVKPVDSILRFERTIEAMLRHSTATVSRRSALVNVTVSLPEPYVAKLVSDQLVDAVTSLNDRVRQVKGRAERLFSEGRLKIARTELTAAEDSLKDFLERNRQAETPNLQMEKMRRSRLVDAKQQVMTSVALSYETARAEEVRNTPRVSVIIPPRVPVTGDARGTIRKTFVVSALVFTVFVVLYWFADRWGDGSILRMVWRAVRLLFTASAPPETE